MTTAAIGYMPMPAGFQYRALFQHGRPRHEKYDSFWRKHPPMDHVHRAKIFSAFDALAGFDDCIASNYVYRRDAEFGKDSSVVTKTKAFDLPLRKDRKGEYKVKPEDGVVYTCFTSDFFHPDADEWRSEAWSIMRTRADLDFFFVTKRPERFHVSLPDDWGDGYPNVHICCTCENQYMTDKRLPVFLELPIRHKSIIHEPMLGPIHIEQYLEKYGKDIDQVVCGSESGDDARLCDYAWVIDTMCQCVKYEVPFHFKQTGANLNFKRGDRIYRIPVRINMNRLPEPK